MAMNEADKKTLFKIARRAIALRLGLPDPGVVNLESAGLQRRAGAFVTLHRGGALRGCIGVFTSNGPLHETVAEMALSAAFGDPRFTKLAAREFSEIDIEISVLTPLKRISDVSEIEVGRHGIYIIKGFNRGVLLPQVASEQGWDRDAFLDHTCMKAGLYAGCWRENDVEIYTFEAEILHESKVT
jgi:AmmeMemoRadiSam system protein A